MKKILIPTNFSQISYNAIDYVIKLFKNESCDFYFLNTYLYEVENLNAIEVFQVDDKRFNKPKNKSLEKLGKLVEHYTLNSNSPKHGFHVISECRDLVDSIKNNVERIHADLVILSSRSEKTTGLTNESILEEIRSCPILIVPPFASECTSVYLTIASDFKQKINTYDIERFCKTLVNTNFEIGILVLGAQNQLSPKAADHLESLIIYLRRILTQPIDLEYTRSSNDLGNYAISHSDRIMCVIDKKPDLFRKIGLYKSNAISKIAQLPNNTILTIHQ